MKGLFIFVFLLSFFVSTLEALKCHALVKNYKNYTKFHTDEGEDCSSLSKYCFSVSGRVSSVNNVYIAGCSELLTDSNFSTLHLICSNNSDTNVNTAENKYEFKCCDQDMCNLSFTTKISIGFLCTMALSFFMNFKIYLL